MASVSASSNNEFPESSDKHGEVVFSGGASWSMTGRSSATKSFDGVPADQILLSFHRLKPMMNIPVAKVICGPLANHSLIIDSRGFAYAWGRNEDGQLGVGDTTNRYNPVKLNPGSDDVMERFRGGACGLGHSMLVTVRGSVYSTGANTMYQLGTGRKDQKFEWTLLKDLSVDVKEVGCGKDFSMLTDIDGNMYACGSPMYGQLGNGTDGKTLEKAGKFTYECWKRFGRIAKLAGVSIKQFSVGANHTAAVDVLGKLYTWGFGGYGRLGLGHNKDVMEPTPVPDFSAEAPPRPPGIPDFMWKGRGGVKRVSKVACGAQCTYAIGAQANELYFFGITKQSGEATMKPQLVEGVSGWRCNSVASGQTSTILSASYGDPTLITWGGSPTWGELGYGENEPKSNTKPAEVSYFHGCTMLDVSMGYAHSLAIVKYNNPGKKALAKLKVFDPKEVGSDSSEDSGGSTRKRDDEDDDGAPKKKSKKA